MTHTPSAIVAVPANEAGRLDGFESVCTCGLRIANTFKVNVELDVREHLAYWAAKA